ncbi:hypothetical protein AAC387_Pa03g0393 [Persea americana]
MACTASKLDKEDKVHRCKEWRCLMKQVIFSRHHLVAAHSNYFRSLRLTCSTLSTFAVGEALSVSDGTPAILLHPPSSTSSTTTNTTAHVGPPPPLPRPFTPSPQPPPHPFTPSPQPPPHPPFTPSSPTITSSKVPHILCESSPFATPPQKPSFPKYPKYPHLPTNSSFTPLLRPPPFGELGGILPSLPSSSDFYRRSDEPHYLDDDCMAHPDFDSHSIASDNSNTVKFNRVLDTFN